MNCPDCNNKLAEKEEELELDDTIVCDDCGVVLTVVQLDPVVLESDYEPDLIDDYDDDEDDEEDDEENDEEDYLS